jgi:hypothetical protein
MATLYLILLVVAALCFGAAAINVVASRVNLIALGLLAYVLVPLIQRMRGLS